jgi:hypothetical protein
MSRLKNSNHAFSVTEEIIAKLILNVRHLTTAPIINHLLKESIFNTDDKESLPSLSSAPITDNIVPGNKFGTN